MNINFKTYPILKLISQLKNQKKVELDIANRIDNDFLINFFNEKVKINYNEILGNFTHTKNINILSENITEKIFDKNENIFDDLIKFIEFFEDDEGIFIDKQRAIYYKLKKDDFGINYLIQEIVCTEWDQLLFSSVQYGLIQENDIRHTQIKNTHYACHSLVEFHRNNKDLDFFQWEFDSYRLIQLIKTLVLKNFAPIETEQIFVSDKVRQRYYRPNKNQLGLKINYITSQWFTNLERSGAFGVKGHWRLQACGEGMKDRKLIWVKDFVKEGYSRRAQRIIQEDSD